MTRKEQPEPTTAVAVEAISAPTDRVEPSRAATAPVPAEDQARLDAVAKLCEDLRHSISHEHKWKIDPCGGLEWKVWGKTTQGRPLIYGEFGNAKALNTTLILSMVHGDEVTPLYLGLELAHWLKEHQAQLVDTRVILAPLVNPDGYFAKPRTRVNGRGVDVNRNFATKDWSRRALNAWRTKFGSNPRRYPGKAPASEPETAFQEELIRRTQPQKILSMHAPLNFMDYDGPDVLALDKFPREYVRECLRLRERLKAISGGFFPGSLGNFAGQELGIPTLTLELPSANARKADAYWQSFRPGIKTMIEFQVPAFARSVNDVSPAHGG